MTRLNEFVIANAYGFPAEGTLVGDSMVAASGVDIANNRWFVIFDGTVQKPTISEMLKKSLGRTKYFTSNGDVYEISTGKKFGVESTRTNPSSGLQTVVSGSITSTHIRKNPVSVSDFRSEMRDMFVSDPRRDFKEINSPKAHSSAFRDVLFSFVSYRGESYGWLKGGKIYHRRGSLIMPKLKVNRAVEGSSAFYHTHPSKDEPSLSSADDYQFYLDLAYAFGIKHFYTVMENRIDHFQFTVKKAKEEDYLKMDEDKLLDDINAIIDGAEADTSKKHKGDKGLTDEDFYSKMTRETVNRLNKRFKEFVTIKYSGHAKPGLVRENPGDAGFRHNPPIRISHIHKASQLEELRDTTNNFEHYGANEYGHSQYVYWWVDHHFSLTPLHPHGRLFKLKDLGLDDETRRSLRAYMSEELAPGYSHLDVLLLLALYHDVGKVREKETGIHHSIIASEMFQNEIGPELGLPPEITDACALLMMTDCGRRNITPDAFIAQAGDYLPVAYMLKMADMLAHHPFMFTSRASEAKAEGLIDKANVEEYKKKIAHDLFANIKTFLEQRVKTNPPPSVSYIVVRGSYETPIDGDIAEEYFGEEWENPKTIKSGFYHNGQIRLRDPKSGLAFAITVKDGSFTMYVRKQFFSPDDEYGLELAKDIYTRVGRILSEFTPGIRLEDVPEPDVMVNPRHSVNLHVITVSGPSGVGKSTIARNLAAMLDADLIPTVTTRPRRPREKIGQDRVFVTEKRFREMIDAGDLVEWKKQKNGHFYGRRFSDFTKPTAVVDVSLKGMRKYREAFPHTTTIFLDPDVTPEQLAKRILRRGGMTKEEATARARIASKQIADAHNMDFDMYVKSKTGKFEEIAKQIADDIEKKNPPATNFFPGEAVVDYPWLRHADLIKQNVPIYEMSSRKIPEVMYHGTSASRLEQILKDGNLAPRHSHFMGEGVYLTPDRELAVAYATAAAGGRAENGRVIDVNVRQMEKDSKHLVIRRRMASRTSVLDKEAEIYTVDAPIPLKYFDHVWKKGGEVDLDRYRLRAIMANPPISHYLNEVDRHYIDYVKSKMRRVSEVAKDTEDHYMVVYEIPVMEKQSDNVVRQIGTTRLLFYSRTGTGSAILGRTFAEALLNQSEYDGERLTRYDTMAEGPFLHNIAWKKWGDPRGKDFAPLMWMSMLGYDAGWYVKPKEERMFNFMTGEPITKPAFPSKKFESKFSSRWGHRSMFYAGIALTELIPNPAAQWSGKTLTKNNINLFMKKHGAIIADRSQKHQDAIYVPPDEARVNPKSRQEWFEDWAKLINMKNKELEAFLNSPLGKKAGLSPSEAKAQGIHSGRVSGRAILRMRKKIGLGGPKDYIKGPVHAKAVFQKAKRVWNDNDWEWCARQVRFNKRFMGDVMGKRKGPLVRDGQPTRRLLALWVWGFDPWRYARKVEKRKTMPKCPKVPWIGMTEKRMYGVQKNEVRMNPPPQTDLGGNTVPEIQPHLDWPMWNAPVWVPRNLIPDDAVLVRPQIGEPYYHIRQEDLDELLTSQEYLQAQEAHRQRVAREAQERREANRRAGQKFLDDFRSNPHHVHTGAFLIYTGKHRTWDNGKQGIEAGDIVRVGNMSVQPGDATMPPDVGITVPLHPIKSFIMTRPKRFSLSWVENNFEPAPDRMEDILPDELTNPPPQGYSLNLEAENRLVPNEDRAVRSALKRKDGRPMPPRHRSLRQYRYVDDSTGKVMAFVGTQERPAVQFTNKHGREMSRGSHILLYFTISSEASPRGLWRELMNDVLRDYGNRTMVLERNSAGAVAHQEKSPEDSGVWKPNTTIPDHKLKEIYESFGFRDAYIPGYKGRAMVRLPKPIANPPLVPTTFTQPYRGNKRISGETTLFPEGTLVEATSSYVIPIDSYASIELLVRAGSVMEVQSHLSTKGPILREVESVDEIDDTNRINYIIRDPRYAPEAVQVDYPWFVANHKLHTPHVMEDSLPDELTNPPPLDRYSELVYEGSEQPLGITLKIGDVVIVLDSRDGSILGKAYQIAKRWSSVNARGTSEGYTPIGWVSEEFLLNNFRESPNIEMEDILPDELTNPPNNLAFDNPRTPGGKKFPTRYLKGLNALEKMIAEDEIDKGYKYDADDPKAYEFWKSDIKATARGMKIGPSKHRLKYYKRYRKNIDKDYKPSGDSPKRKFINRVVKETGIKRSIIEKIYDKGLAAWRVGHRPGVQQHQWAAGRVYAFAVGADSSTGPGKPDNKLAVEAGVRKK